MEEFLPGNYRLSERKKLILKEIIDAYITYGEPVGSKYLAENQQLACSSATIRNEMAELEALGYLVIRSDQLTAPLRKWCVIVAIPPTPPGAKPLLFWKK